MKCISIAHCKNSNYQIDYAGTKAECVDRFKDWCSSNDVLWANLFDESDGTEVASFGQVMTNYKEP